MFALLTTGSKKLQLSHKDELNEKKKSFDQIKKYLKLAKNLPKEIQKKKIIGERKAEKVRQIFLKNQKKG